MGHVGGIAGGYENLGLEFRDVRMARPFNCSRNKMSSGTIHALLAWCLGARRSTCVPDPRPFILSRCQFSETSAFLYFSSSNIVHQFISELSINSLDGLCSLFYWNPPHLVSASKYSSYAPAFLSSGQLLPVFPVVQTNHPICIEFSTWEVWTRRCYARRTPPHRSRFIISCI